MTGLRQAEELGLSLNEATYEILAHMALRCCIVSPVSVEGSVSSLEFDN